MPTYEYKCRNCGEKFDQIQSITDLPISKCPSCGGPVERIISGGSGMLFKGKGFYKTDYRSDSYKKAAQAEKSSESSSSASSSDSKKSDTKASSSDLKKLDTKKD
jgi:putative FmdB family regulatory protein